jgi:hypothetical protein
VKKRASKARLADIERKIEVQRRRAARPTLPVNTHAPVSKSLVQKKKSVERKARQRRAWDDD